MIASALLLGAMQAKGQPASTSLEDFFKRVEERRVYAECATDSLNYRVWLNGSACRVERASAGKATEFGWVAVGGRVLSIDYANKHYFSGFELGPGYPAFQSKPHRPWTMDYPPVRMPYPLEGAFHWPGPGWKLVTVARGPKRVSKATSVNPYNTGNWSVWLFDGPRLVAYDWGVAGEKAGPSPRAVVPPDPVRRSNAQRAIFSRSTGRLL